MGNVQNMKDNRCLKTKLNTDGSKNCGGRGGVACDTFSEVNKFIIFLSPPVGKKKKEQASINF